MIVTSVSMKSSPLPLCYAITSELFTHRDLLLESRSTKGQRVMMGVEMERTQSVIVLCVFWGQRLLASPIRQTIRWHPVQVPPRSYDCIPRHLVPKYQAMKYEQVFSASRAARQCLHGAGEANPCLVYGTKHGWLLSPWPYLFATFFVSCFSLTDKVNKHWQQGVAYIFIICNSWFNEAVPTLFIWITCVWLV